MNNGPESYSDALAAVQNHGHIGWISGWPGEKFIIDQSGTVVLSINGNIGAWNPTGEEESSQNWFDGPDHPPHP